MWVVNEEKERAKQYLRSDIESNITNLSDVSNRIHESMAGINRAMAGSMLGADRQMLDECQRSLKEVSTALENLYSCRNYVEQLETREWVEDE